MTATLVVITPVAYQRSGVNTILVQTMVEAVGLGIVNNWMEIEIGLGVASDRADTSVTVIKGAPQEEISKPALAGDEKTRIRIVAGEDTTVFELNNSAAVKSLYRQLSLSLDVENFSSNEKTFYPPEELDITDILQTTLGMGTLACYAPWGDMVAFYGDYSPSG